MAKLIFTHAVMNSGKSTSLLQANYNYTSEGKKTILLSSSFDDRYGKSVIASRLGFKEKCFSINENVNIFEYVKKKKKKKTACVFVDEAQFLTREQVIQLSDIVDEFNIPVMAYGLKNNFKSELFEGSAALLSYANEIRELKQACFCGKAANMILRYSPEGNILKDGAEIVIGAESMYRSVCRKHWKEGDLGRNFITKTLK